MSIINAETVIHIPPTELFAFHSDFRKQPLWHDHVLSSELLTGDPIGAGSRFRTTNKLGWLTMTTREHITVFDPPHQYSYELDSAPLHISNSQRFIVVAEGTHFQIQVEMQARNWLGKIIQPLIAKQQTRHFATAVQEFKQYCEGHYEEEAA